MFMVLVSMQKFTTTGLTPNLHGVSVNVEVYNNGSNTKSSWYISVNAEVYRPVGLTTKYSLVLVSMLNV